jgi:hypothetical protein
MEGTGGQGRGMRPDENAYVTTLELAWHGQTIETQHDALTELRAKAEELGFIVTGAHSGTAKEEHPIESMSWGGEPFRNRKALETKTPASAGL